MKYLKRVLIITYYWLPSGGSGVQRWVKFVKYLRNFGWEPIVYTPSNPEYPVEDFSFEKDIPKDIEILKTPIWEPYDIYRKLTGKRGQKINAGFITENKKAGWKERLSIWIRGNFLIPDPRIFWKKPSLKFLSKYLSENPVDVIVTTGPPHSLHLIGLELKKRFPTIPWVADFRDPWTKIYYFKDLMLTKLSNTCHLHLEKKVLKNADKVVVVSNVMKNDFEKFAKYQPSVITNGFDEDDVKLSEKSILDTHFTISYIGLLSPNQNPSKLWKVLKEIAEEDREFAQSLQIQLIGKIDFSAIEDLNNLGLKDNLILKDYIPHQEAIKKQQSSQLLLLLLPKDRETAKGVLTGKFFEYLASGRPILAIGVTNGDVADILQETGAGKIVDFKDKEGMKETVLDFYNSYKNGQLTSNVEDCQKYSRKYLTGLMAEMLNEIVKQ